jgi:predicted permease
MKRSFRLSDSKPDAKRDVDDEVAFHLEMRTRELIEQGMPPDEARRQAAAVFGDVAAIRSDLRAERGARNVERTRRDWWQALRMDSLYAIRSLRANPAFAAATIATLALGIGASLAVFTVVNGVLLRPLPYPDADRAQMIWILDHSDGSGFTLPLTSGFFNDVQTQTRNFQSVAAFRSWPSSLADASGGEPERVAAARVSYTLFDVLGVHPARGQAFTREQSVPGGPRVAIVSHDLWQRRFGGDPALIGRQIRLNNESFTVSGIMPSGFAFPRGAELPAPFQFGARTDVWLPLAFDSSDVRNYGTMNLSAIGRLAPGSTAAAAQAELSNMMKAFLAANAPNVKLDYKLVSMAEQAAGKVRRGLLILLGAVAFVLVIASANVASLLIARVAGRQRELAVRAALGAGRARIARQLVTENVVLAVVGTTLGVVLSYWATRLMLALVPGSLPRADDVGLDWRVLSVAALVALVAGVIFGTAAAYSVRWGRLSGALHSGGARSAGSTGQRYGRRLMVAAEVALSLVLLIGAALLTRSFIALQRIQPGFDATNVLTAHVGVPVPGRFDPAANAPRWSATLNGVVARLASAPGVVAAGAVSSLPLSGAYESGGLRIPGYTPPDPNRQTSAQYNIVAGAYFAAAGIRVREGRVFDSSDDAPGRATIVVNREFVRRYLPNEANVLGRTVNAMFEFTRNPPPRVIVGVVDDVRQTSLDEEPMPQVYVPQSQMSYPGLAVLIRTRGDPATAIAMLKREVRAVDPAATVDNIKPMEDVVAHSLARQRFSMTLIAVFAGVALVLAIVGLYGVLALLVGQRRREIGVRLALGARPQDVVRLVLGEGVRVTGVGVVLGLLGAAALTRVLATLLYGVSTTDAVTFTGAAIVVIVVSLAATYGPARRAARVDPKSALVAE